MAAQRIESGEGDVYIAGGVESISCVQNEMNQHMAHEGWLVENKPEIYWNMLQTAEEVSKRYDITANPKTVTAPRASNAPPRHVKRGSSTTRSCP